MFCAAMRRDVFEEVGPLDERFEVGMFEDDDYARRVREAGYSSRLRRGRVRPPLRRGVVRRAGRRAASATASSIANRRRFEEKWGVEWKPHGRRVDPGYERLLERLRKAVREEVPPGATVLVVSRGDEELVGLDGHRALHFPQGDGGSFAGHHPADSDEAIAQLERLRESGADYLVLPATSLWWLEHYKGFRRHLDRYRRAIEDPETAVIYQLEERVGAPALPGSA